MLGVGMPNAKDGTADTPSMRMVQRVILIPYSRLHKGSLSNIHDEWLGVATTFRYSLPV